MERPNRKGTQVDAPGCPAWETALITRSQAGDTTAFGELLQHYEKRIYSLVRRLVPRQEEAVELTQEAFLQAFKAQPRFRVGSALRPWLYQIAINVCRNHRRAFSRREQAQVLPEGVPPLWIEAAENPEVEAARRDEGVQVGKLLQRLGQEDRALLLLRFQEEMSYEELRTVYGLPATVLKMRVHRALTRLRQAALRGLQ